MTTTSQSESAGSDGTLPPDTKPAAKEPNGVPVGEHVETRQKLRDALDKVAALEAKLAQSEKPSVPATPKAKTGDDQPNLQQIADRLRADDLADELGLNRKQATAVADLMKKMPDATPAEALAIMAMRDPEGFKERGQQNGAQAQFGSLRPRPGAQPEPQAKTSDWKDRIAHTQSLLGKDKRQHAAYANNMAGKLLAKAMGWEHQDLPLPKK